MDHQSLATSKYRLIVPGGLFSRLHYHLFPGDGDEHGAVIAAGMAKMPDGSINLLARYLYLAEDGKDYVPGKRGYRMLKAEFIRSCIFTCRDEKLVYLAVHNHGGEDSVGFSSDDLNSHERGYPALLDIAAGMPVGALVFARNAIAGDIWLPNGKRVALESAKVLGTSRKILTPAPVLCKVSVDPAYDRQTRLFGDAGQDILRDTTIGIIGLGGVGAIIAEYLARLGVGNFVLIDPQKIEISNFPRIVGATRWDCFAFFQKEFWPSPVRSLAKFLSKPKVKIAARVIRQANKNANIKPIIADTQSKEAVEALIGCDYLFLAADSMSARLIFNQIVHQYYIPGVQIGSKISHEEKSGDLTAVFSVVRPVNPEKGCLWCNQLINPLKLQEEAQSEKELKANKYLDDSNVIAPSVITLNAVGAAHATHDFLLFITGLMSPQASNDYARYMMLERKSEIVEPRRDEYCSECGTASGSRLGRGDQVPLTLKY